MAFRRLVGVAGLVTVVFVGCEGSPLGGGRPSVVDCVTNADCELHEFCNPHHACTIGCRATADCFAGTVCITATGECAQLPEPVCTPSCGGAQVCDDHAGAGVPTCVDRCTYDGCDSSQNCDLTTGLCRIAASCDSTLPQPDSCLYGQVCTASDVCDYVPKATCSSFTAGGKTPTWNPATSTGPIIASLEPLELVPDIDFCSTTRNQFVLAKVRMTAYRTTGAFGLQEPDFLSELHLYRADGTEATGDERPLAFNLLPSDDQRNVSVDIYFCVPGTPTEVVAGLQFQGGNEACVTVR